jgi:regulator of protease activity HflC (stomatin/prohibitin superfamily)
MDMREAVVPFPPQGVITEDNLMVGIDSVIYYQIVDPVRAAYEAQNYIQAIEQLTRRRCATSSAAWTWRRP